MKTAFATYLCNDVFIPGAVALINSLNHFKTQHDVICMVTDGVSEKGRKTLENSGFLLKNIEKIVPNRVEGIKDRYKDNSWMMFTKLNLWRMTEYEKLVFIDADCIVLCNVDEMMEYPAVSAVRDVGYGGISAGVLVLEPNQSVFDDMMKNLDNDVYDNTYSDQSFLDWYLKDRNIWIMPNPGDSGSMINRHFIPLIFHFGGIRSIFPSELLESIDFYVLFINL